MLFSCSLGNGSLGTPEYLISTLIIRTFYEAIRLRERCSRMLLRMETSAQEVWGNRKMNEVRHPQMTSGRLSLMQQQENRLLNALGQLTLVSSDDTTSRYALLQREKPSQIPLITSVLSHWRSAPEIIRNSHIGWRLIWEDVEDGTYFFLISLRSSPIKEDGWGGLFCLPLGGSPSTPLPRG